MKVFDNILLWRLRRNERVRAKLNSALSKRGVEPANIAEKQPHQDTINFLAVSAGAFLVVLSLALFMPLYNKSTSAYQNNYTAAGKYVKITASPSVVMNLETMSNYATTYQHDSIIVESNASNYDVYLSTNSNSNSLFLDGDISKDYLSATNVIGSNLIGMSTNSWGYGISTNGPTTSQVASTIDPYQILFYPVPIKNSETKIISYSGSESISSNTYDVYFGVKANKDKPSGTYSNDVLYSAISNTSSTTGTATVSPTTVMMGNTINITTDLTTNMDLGDVTITLTNKATNEQTACLSITHNTVDNIIILSCTIPNNIDKGLYTVSASVPKFSKTYSPNDTIVVYQSDTFFGITTMQQMTTNICNTATTPSTTAASSDTTGDHSSSTNYVPETTLYDIRGNGAGEFQTYKIRKLADDNCWMAQNLELKLSTTVELTDQETDLNTKSTWTPQYDTVTSQTVNWDDTTARSYDQGNLWYKNSVTKTTTDTGNPSNRAGIWYNWYAATAGTGLASMTQTSANPYAFDSICPKGWRLPLDDNSLIGENGKYFSYTHLLYDIYGLPSNSDAKVLVFPFEYPRNGTISSTVGSGSIYNQGIAGYYTNIRANTTLYFHGFRFDSSMLHATQNLTKSYGNAIRCVAR